MILRPNTQTAPLELPDVRDPTPDELGALTVRAHRFADEWAQSLTALVGRQVSVQVQGPEVPRDRVLEGDRAAWLSAVLSSPSGRIAGCIAFSPWAWSCLVDWLACGEVVGQQSEPTPLEERLLTVVVESASEAFGRAFGGRESGATGARTAEPDRPPGAEPRAAAASGFLPADQLAAAMGADAGLVVCPVRLGLGADSLDTALVLSPPPRSSPPLRSRIEAIGEAAVLSSEVEVAAVVEGGTMTLGDVSRLKPGDVLAVAPLSQVRAVVTVEGIPKLSGRLGVKRGGLAVEVLPSAASSREA